MTALIVTADKLEAGTRLADARGRHIATVLEVSPQRHPQLLTVVFQYTHGQIVEDRNNRHHDQWRVVR